MPVEILLCEGGKHSLDIRLLTPLLAGVCKTIHPVGGKYGMAGRILARRTMIPKVFGLLDGDFLVEWQEPENRPRKWEPDLGWRWERKEVENYLLDPVVVAHTLPQLDPEHYLSELEAARTAIAIQQAARTALAASRKQLEPLPSSLAWSYRMDEAHCLTELKKVVRTHGEEQELTWEEVETRFYHYLPECLPGGVRYGAYLHAFAGKDLLRALESFIRMEMGGTIPFLEGILKGLSPGCHTWLPEWNALRQSVAIA